MFNKLQLIESLQMNTNYQQLNGVIGYLVCGL